MQTIKLQELIVRDLEKVKEELMLFGDSDIWSVEGSINNSAGNLVLHICGNLRHFVGAVLGGSGYVRARDNEFADKNVPINQLTELLDLTIADVNSAFEALTEPDLAAPYPARFPNGPADTFQMLVHLHGHLNYHLGQINYYRRLL